MQQQFKQMNAERSILKLTNFISKFREMIIIRFNKSHDRLCTDWEGLVGILKENELSSGISRKELLTIWLLISACPLVHGENVSNLRVNITQ